MSGDLRLGVGYRSTGLDRWVEVLGYRTAGATASPGAPALLTLGALGAMCWVVWLALGPLAAWPASVRGRYSLAAASAAAVSVTVGLLWIAVTPPYLAPDEVQHLHDSRRAYLLSLGRESEAVDDTLGIAIYDDMLRARWRILTGTRPASRPVDAWWNDPAMVGAGRPRFIQPPTFYESVALASRFALGSTASVRDQLYVGRAVSLAFGALSAALVSFAVLALIPGRTDLAAAAGAIAALMPQRSFILSSVNNDSLAVLAGAIACVAMCLGLRSRQAGVVAGAER